VQYLHPEAWRDVRRSSEEKGLILSSGVQAQMSRRIQMAFIVFDGALVSLKMRGWIQGENMMLVIEFMSEYLAIERPTEGIGQHADQQGEHHQMDAAHDIRDFIPLCLVMPI
jgi:hypothetical protein